MKSKILMLLAICGAAMFLCLPTAEAKAGGFRQGFCGVQQFGYQQQFVQPQFIPQQIGYQLQFVQPQFVQPQFVQPQFVQPQIIQQPIVIRQGFNSGFRRGFGFNSGFRRGFGRRGFGSDIGRFLLFRSLLR